MAYTDNHCDLNKIKDKPIYGFTVRQIISFAVIVIIAVPLYAIMLSKQMDTTVACLIIGLIAFPLFYTGTYEDINGRTVEKILHDKIRLMFRTKAKRPFSTYNSYEAIKNQQILEKKYRDLARKEILRKKQLAAKKKKVVKFSFGKKRKDKKQENSASA